MSDFIDSAGAADPGLACDVRPASEAGFSLPARLLLSEAARLAGQLRERRGAPLSIDASNVVAIETPCVEALISAALTWTADGHPLAVVEPSEAFLGALARLGLDLDAISSDGGRPAWL